MLYVNFQEFLSIFKGILMQVSRENVKNLHTSPFSIGLRPLQDRILVEEERRMQNSSIKSSITQRKVRDQPGPLTAHQAWEIMLPVAKELDSQAQLTFITSGLDMSREGRSFTWEFLFILPKPGVRVLLSVEPSSGAEDIDNAPVMLVQRLNPVSAAEVSRAAKLPESFRDSPEVVAEFAAAGVDFGVEP
jgi:hypothetical protein